MSIELALAAARNIFSAYGGYQKGKLAQSDQALREEVRRRSRMVRDHIEAVHDKAHKKRMKDLRSTIKEVMECCDSLEDDARYSTSHTPKATHDVQVDISKKILKKLVNHDLETLERMVKATRSANELVHDLSTNQDEDVLVRQASDLRQSLTGARNHFRERNMIFDGYTKK
jgi:hypothetical protein